MKVLIQFFSPFLVSIFLHVSLVIVLSFGMIQTLLSQAILPVKDLGKLSPQLSYFVFSLVSKDLL